MRWIRIAPSYLDFDKAFEEWKRIEQDNKGKWTRDNSHNEENGLLLKHRIYNAFLALLPVPAIRQNLASEEFGRNSYLSIEMLFDDKYLDGFTEEIRLPGGGRVNKMKEDKKSQFAERTAKLPQEAFDNFAKLFLLINEIVKKFDPPPQTLQIQSSVIVETTIVRPEEASQLVNLVQPVEEPQNQKETTTD